MKTDYESILKEIHDKRTALDGQYKIVREEALAECRHLVRIFSFTAEELKVANGNTAGSGSGGSPSSSAKMKWFNPRGTEKWSGRGSKKPKWYLDNLAAGITEEEMRIKD